MTSYAVTAYGVGLIGLVLVKILAPGYYARQDVRTPVKIGLVVMAATQAMNLVFVPMFQHAGLALSIGLGACVNALLLLVGLVRRGVYRPKPGWTVASFVEHAELRTEPLAAVFAAGDGLDPYRRLVEAAPRWLAPDGIVLLQLHRRIVVAGRGELQRSSRPLRRRR